LVPLLPSLGASASDCPSSGRNKEGFGNAVGPSSRTILHHKVGLPLACYLHHDSSSIPPYFPSFSVEGVIGVDDHDEIFEKRFDAWKGEDKKTARRDSPRSSPLTLSNRWPRRGDLERE
jgi:hypothetical protein